MQVGGSGPRAWLLEHRELIAAQPRGRALDVACGRGREAIELARLGFTVEATDVSDVALAMTLEAARAAGVSVLASRVDLASGSHHLAERRYDVVTCFYFLQRSLFAAMAAALAPGGLLLYETFTRDHVDVLGGDMPERYLLEHNELLRGFADLRVLHYREGVIDGDRQRAVASLVARRT